MRVKTFENGAPEIEVQGSRAELFTQACSTHLQGITHVVTGHFC